MSVTVKEAVPDNAAKRMARLAAVQGLYQIALSERTAAMVIRDFRAHPPSILLELPESSAATQDHDIDHELFAAIVTGVTEHIRMLDGMIGGALDARMSVERLEILLRLILRAGAYELHHRGETPAGVIINDYVDVTHAFFNEKEPGLVNAVLDRLAKNLRS